MASSAVLFAALPAHAFAISPWQLKFPTDTGDGSTVTILDRRPEDSKQNKAYGAASYNFQTQVGDDRTQPDRVSYFKARLERSHLRENGKLMVALNRFDVWLDRTGTSPSGFFIAGKIAVMTSSHANGGNNKLSCTINSQVDENYISANADVLYQPDESAAAMQHCFDDVIDKWIEVARAKLAK